jgi:hypothetical protein
MAARDNTRRRTKTSAPAPASSLPGSHYQNMPTTKKTKTLFDPKVSRRPSRVPISFTFIFAIFLAAIFNPHFLLKVSGQAVMSSPSSGSYYGMKTGVTLTYTLSDTVAVGTLQFSVRPIFGGATRLITIDDTADDGAGSTYGAIGTHTIQIQAELSTIVTDNAAVTAISPDPTTDITHVSPSGSLLFTKLLYTNTGGTARQSGVAIYYWDGLTEPPVVTNPVAGGSIGVDFNFVFSLKEVAAAGTVKLTMTPSTTDARASATDSAAPRVIVFSSTDDASVTFTNLQSAATDVDAITSVTPNTNLVSRCSYDLLFEYNDLYNNGVATLAINNVLHDTVTLDIVAVAPTASARIPIQFTGTFTLPENAFQALLIINPLDATDPACPSDNTAAGACLGDSLPSRIVTFGNTFKTAGTHQFTVPADGLSGLAASEANILDVECDGQASCDVDLIHGSLYFFTYKYKDTLQNVDSSNNEYSEDGIIVTFDSQTFAPVLTKPINMSRVLDGFTLEYELLEAAATTTLTMVLTVQTWSEVADPNSPHTIVFDQPKETAAVHGLPITNLTLLSHHNYDVLSVSPADQDLINGATYRLELSYQDVAGNTAAGLTGNVFFIFDSATVAPVLTSPASDSSVGASFTVAFTMPEAMKDGTCTITIAETGGLVDDPVPNPRVLTLGTAEHAKDSYSYTLTSSHIAQTPFPQSWVASVSSKFDLSDGTEYSFTLSCEDVAGNVAVSVTNTGILYAGSTTLAPVLTKPAAAQCLSRYVLNDETDAHYSTFVFNLLEPAQANTVSLTLNPTSGCGALSDSNGARVIELGGVTTAGAYAFNLSSTLANLVADETLVTAISGAGGTAALVDGVFYTVTLSYQDSLGNGAVTASSAGVAFSGITTMAPTLTAPANDGSLGLTFAVTFTLPEPAQRGSLRLEFAHATGTADPAATRVMLFSDEVETCGTAHTVNIGGAGLVAAADLSAVESITPATALVDGAVYTVTLKYNDCGGHAQQVTADRSVEFAGTNTLPPTLIEPGTLSSIANDFFIEYNLPERACQDSVYLTFLRSGGLVTDAYTGARTVRLGASSETRGNHRFQMTWFRDAVANIPEVASVTPSDPATIDLVHGSKYLVDLFYQDSVCNPVQSAGSIEVTFAADFTLTPFFYEPLAEAYIAEIFTVKFTFVEAAKDATSQVRFTSQTPSGNAPPDMCGFGELDPASARVLIFVDDTEGVRELSLTGLLSNNVAGMPSGNAAGVETIVPLTNLVDGACYTVVVAFEDGAGNAEASVSHADVRYVGSTTLAVPAFTPAGGSSIRTAFVLGFSLREPAKAGTLAVTIASLNTAIDNRIDRRLILTGDMNFAGPHVLTFRLLSLITNDVNVLSCNGFTTIGGTCLNLIHDGTYSISIEYQDAASNGVASLTQSVYTYDILTETPTLSSPISTSFISTNFVTQFLLPELATDGTVQITMTPKVTSYIADNTAARLITMASSYALSTAQASATMSELSVANVSNAAIADVTPAVDLVDGSTYDIVLGYQDAAGNDEATASQTDVVFCGSTTLIPTFTAPLGNASYKTSKTATFTLPEQAYPGTVNLTFTHTGHGPFGAAMGASDSNGPRVITFASSGANDLSTTGTHTCALALLDGVQDACVAAVRPAIALVDGEVYSATLSYHDMVMNTKAEVVHFFLEHDLTTQAPSFLVPASGSTVRIKVAFELSVNIPEVATEDTVQLRIDPVDPVADSNGARTIVFSREESGIYTVPMTNLSIAATDVSGIVSVTPAIDLIHLVQYIFKIQYQDELRNAPASDFTGALTFDVVTATPTLSFPIADSTFRLAFTLDFTLPENALASTVFIVFEPTGRVEGDGWKYHGTTIDVNAERTISFSITAANRYQITMQDFSTAAAAVDSITSIAPATGLVHLNSYDIRVQFRDSAGNIPTVQTVLNCTFDIVTIDPTLNAPAANSYVPTSFTANFLLPEVAMGGTVTLTWTYVSSVLPQASPEDDAPHVITFSSDTVTALSIFDITMTRLSQAAAVLNDIANVEPIIITEAADLQDGATYDLTLSYQDAAGNIAATNQVAGVHFVGDATMAALVNSPSNDDSIPQEWSLDVVLYERMAECNVTIDLVSGPADWAVTAGRTEPITSRVMMFDPQALTPGSHVWTFGQLSLLTSVQPDVIDQVVNPYDLVIGAVYNLALVCVDMSPNGANGVATTSITNVEFAGNRTLTPTFVAPAPFTSQRQSFLVNFTLPESALAGSVLLLLDPQHREVGVNDPHGLRTIVFSNTFETSGQHSGTMQSLDVAASLGFVSSVTPATALVDGTIYVARLQYRDSVGNSQAGVNHTEIHYAGVNTIVPALPHPLPNTRIPESFWLEFELFEKAYPGTVTLTFERTGGVLDSAARVVSFGTNFEAAGSHIMQFVRMVYVNQSRYPTEFGSTGGVSPQVDLTDGTEYDVTLTYRDNALNPASSFTNSFVTFDNTKPTLSLVVFHYGLGTMTLTFSEIIDMTVADFQVLGVTRIANVGFIDLSQFALSDSAGGATLFTLNDTDAYSLTTTRTSADADGLEITFTFTELQRIALLAKSGTAGGDTSATFLNLGVSAVFDMATNRNALHSMVITEIADIIKPIVLSATINLDTGVIVITSSEIIDSTPISKIDPSKLRLSNTAGDAANGALVLTNCIVTEGGYGFNNDGVKIAPTSIIDDYIIQLTLLESDRALAIAISGENGGDGVAMVLDLTEPGALVDIAQNNPEVTLGVVVVETPDTTNPRVLNASITLGDGVLTLLCSEFIDLTPNNHPQNVGVKVDFSKFHLSDTSGANDAVPNLLGATVDDTDLISVSITLTEAQRVLAIEHSATPGGDGVALIFDVDGGALKDIAQNFNDATNTFYQFQFPGVLVTEHADAIAPTIVEVRLDLSYGVVTIVASETVDTSNVNLTRMFLSDVSGTHDIPLKGSAPTYYDVNEAAVTTGDGVEFNITLSELQRVTALALGSTPGGSGGVLVFDSPLSQSFTDIGQNPNPPQSDIAIIESADVLVPNILSATLNYSTGILILQGSETIDTTPDSFLDLSKYHLSESTGANTINLAGATTTAFDRTVVTITLTEAQRAAAVVSSNTPGGDTSAIVLDVTATGCRDVAGNLNPNNFNLVVTETSDTVLPVIEKAFIALSTGTIIISTSETLDLAVPSAEVDLTKLYIANGLVHSFTINSASYDVIQHVPVTQNNGFVVWELGINPDNIEEDQGVTVTQLTSGASGTLRTSLTGAGMASISVTSNAGGVSFDTVNDVVIGGSTTVQGTNVLSAVTNGDATLTR